MHANFEIGRKLDWRDESHCCVRSCCGLDSRAPPSASQKPRKHPKKASDKHLHFYVVSPLSPSIMRNSGRSRLNIQQLPKTRA